MRVRGLKSPSGFCAQNPHRGVAPHAGAWIEINPTVNVLSVSEVAPHAGAWIEIVRASLMIEEYVVAPHAGAWIEIMKQDKTYWNYGVAPHAGAWIEIPLAMALWAIYKTVAPHAGAWIEINASRKILIIPDGRTPCGCVD